VETLIQKVKAMKHKIILIVGCLTFGLAHLNAADTRRREIPTTTDLSRQLLQLETPAQWQFMFVTNQASGTTTGLLSSIDWLRFNAKQDLLPFIPLSNNQSGVLLGGTFSGLSQLTNAGQSLPANTNSVVSAAQAHTMIQLETTPIDQLLGAPGTIGASSNGAGLYGLNGTNILGHLTNNTSGNAATATLASSATLAPTYVPTNGGVSFGQVLRNPVSSNQIIVGSSLYPSNVFAGPGTISGTIASRTFTTTNNGFSNITPGYDIVVGNDQYAVVDRPTANTITVFESLNQTYTSSNWIAYPPALSMLDINGNHGSWAKNDGSIVFNTRDNVNINNGRLIFAAGTNSWELSAGYPNPTAPTAFSFRNTGPTGGAGGVPSFILAAQNGNNYEAFYMLQDGAIGIRYGITNTQGPAVTNKAQWVTLKPSFHYQTSTTTSGSGTITGTIATHRLTFSTANTLNLGDTINTALNEQLQVVNVVSSTAVDVAENLQNGYAGSGGWTITPAPTVNFNSSGLFGSSVNQGGGIMVSYPQSITWIGNNKSNNWAWKVALDNSFQLFNLGNSANGNPIQIDPSAGYESMRIRNSGLVDHRFGIVNRSTDWTQIPTAPFNAGDSILAVSNGFPYMVLSTNGSGGVSASWTGTNKVGW
jgi:hypothetical protein